MKLLFFSSDDSEVQLASKKCADAGIPCEVRNSPQLHDEPPSAHCAELWIRHDADSHRALMLCVILGLGFSRRDRTEPIEIAEESVAA